MIHEVDLQHVEAFTAGVIGPRGLRAFFLQLLKDGQTHTYRCEKEMVDALASRLSDLDLDGVVPSDDKARGAFATISSAEFAAERITLEARGHDFLIAIDGTRFQLIDGEHVALTEVNRAILSAAQISEFLQSADGLVEGTRPQCHLCGAHAEPAEHSCINLN